MALITLLSWPITAMQITSSFEAVGHIAHMNLRDEQLPFKKFIGEVREVVC